MSRDFACLFVDKNKRFLSVLALEMLFVCLFIFFHSGGSFSNIYVAFVVWAESERAYPMGIDSSKQGAVFLDP